MAREIAEQPAVYRRILNEGATEIDHVGSLVRARHPRFVLFAARGTSDHAALYGKYIAEIRLGLPAGLVSPSSATIYGARQPMQDVLFIAISQSGSSPDVIIPVEVARESGAVTVAITNDASSPLAQAAEYHLDLLAGREVSVAATKTFSAQMLTLLLFLGSCRRTATRHR